MFTGLIQEIGKIIHIENTANSLYLTVSCKQVLENCKIGDSIAINGACQTVISMTESTFIVFASAETLSVTNFRFLKQGDYVNLERTLRLCDRLEGHIVSGHIDTISKIVAIKTVNENTTITIDLPEKYKKQVVKKGSITIDGISLTIANIIENSIELAIIPHTLNSTTLKFKKIGDYLNIETDLIGKYIENYLYSNNNSNITMDLLERNGFL